MTVIGSFSLPFQGLSIIFQSGLRRYVMIPLLLNIAIYVGLAWLAGDYFDVFMEHYLPEDSWFSWLKPLLWLIFAAAYAIIMFYSFTIIANLVGAPFNGILAAKVEEKLTGKLPVEANINFTASIIPALKSELGKLMYLLKRATPLLIIFILTIFIPGLNLIFAVLLALFGFWFLCIEYADYTMANHSISAKRQREILNQRKFKSFGFGAGVALMMVIPILSFAAMPAAVAGATKLWLEELKDLEGI